MEEIHEPFDVGVPCMVDEYPWSKILRYKVRSLWSPMSWVPYTHKPLSEPQCGELAYGTHLPMSHFMWTSDYSIIKDEDNESGSHQPG